MLQLNEDDLQYLKSLELIVANNIENIMDKCVIFNHLENQQMKDELQSYILEMFSGTIDNEFIRKRNRLVVIYMFAKLPLSIYYNMFDSIAKEIYKLIVQYVEDDNEKIRSVSAVAKIMNLEEHLISFHQQ